MSHKSYVIGVDYGTDSVRSVIMDAADGEEIASSSICLSAMERWFVL